MDEKISLTVEEIQELNALGGLVDRAAEAQKTGSFSQRNPLLGKMINCPKCGRRHRASEENCTAGGYIFTVKEKDASPI